MSPLRKTQIRKLAARETAKVLLASIVSGELEEYVGYRRLYGIWCSNNAAVPELRPFFRIPGIEPDGLLSVTDEFKNTVRSLAREILILFSN